jgi:hypothetical protein
MYQIMQSLVRLGVPAVTNAFAACCLLRKRARWGKGGAVDCTIVEGGRESTCSHALHKDAEGWRDSSDEKVLSGFVTSVLLYSSLAEAH